jgi:hypothetical protein
MSEVLEQGNRIAKLAQQLKPGQKIVQLSTFNSQLKDKSALHRLCIERWMLSVEC